MSWFKKVQQLFTPKKTLPVIQKGLSSGLPENSTLPDNKESIVKGNRVDVKDHYVKTHISNEPAKYKFHNFTRLNAIGVKFTNVNFEHCIFDGCYFKQCVFDSCNFIGCKFIGSNFHVTAFTNCDFRYAQFERTLIDVDILDKEHPLEENLKMRFARSLRINFQQVGEAKSVNRAISLELDATAKYLYKSWASNETYYSDKYGGLVRVSQFFKWIEFKVLDIIWGNGESILKLLRTIALIILGICIHDTISFHDPYNLKDYCSGVSRAISLFFGFVEPNGYSAVTLSFFSALKLTGFALFTTILIKRFSRR